MCTAFKFKNYFARNFDYEQSYNEQITHIPSNNNPYETSFDIIGITAGVTDYPLLYDGMNNQGLCVAGLSFPNNAGYNEENITQINIPSYDVILYILSCCKTVDEAKKLLTEMNITNKNYKDIPASELHWIISDKKQTITLEVINGEINVYNNPFNVLTNNPPFPKMLTITNANLKLIRPLQNQDQEYYTRGGNTNNLKGDYTSTGRFTRTTWLKEELEKNNITDDQLLQTKKLLQTAEQINGITPVDKDYEYTIYSAIYDMEKLELHIKNYTGEYKTFPINAQRIKI